MRSLLLLLFLFIIYSFSYINAKLETKKEHRKININKEQKKKKKLIHSLKQNEKWDVVLKHFFPFNKCMHYNIYFIKNQAFFVWI